MVSHNYSILLMTHKRNQQSINESVCLGSNKTLFKKQAGGLDLTQGLLFTDTWSNRQDSR